MKKDIDHNGEIWVNRFDEENAAKFRTDVLKQSKKNMQAPIFIYIDSYGGAVDSLAKMIATMDETPNPIVTICMGKAMSCGAILLSHGDMRFCDKRSRILVHEVSAGTSGDVHDIGNDADEVRRLNEYWMDVLAKNCKIKGGYKALRQIVKDRDGRDIYLDAKKALEFGIIDQIGVPMIQAVTLFEVKPLPDKKEEKQKITKLEAKSSKKKITKKKATKKKKGSK